MERLTERSLDYCTQLCSDEDAISCAFYKGEQEEKCWRANMYDRLAAYEDTGLEPEEIEARQDVCLWISEERFNEIIKAEAEGRLIVLPCKVGDKYYRIRKFCDMGGDDDFGEHDGSDCEYYCTAPECKHEKRIVEGVFTSVISILTREHLGKHYLTRAEAEAAMKGVSEDTRKN